MVFDWEKDKIFFRMAFRHALHYEGLIIGDINHPHPFISRTIEIWPDIPENEQNEIIAAIKSIIAPAEEARISEHKNPNEVSQWKLILDMEEK